MSGLKRWELVLSDQREFQIYVAYVNENRGAFRDGASFVSPISQIFSFLTISTFWKLCNRKAVRIPKVSPTTGLPHEPLSSYKPLSLRYCSFYYCSSWLVWNFYTHSWSSSKNVHLVAQTILMTRRRTEIRWPRRLRWSSQFVWKVIYRIAV